MLGLPQNPLVGDVEIRLARPEERLRWDRLMAEGHELGFLRFVGRGLRYVAVLGTLWVALAGWQAGAMKCRPRDRSIGVPRDLLRAVWGKGRWWSRAGGLGVFPVSRFPSPPGAFGWKQLEWSA